MGTSAVSRHGDHPHLRDLGRMVAVVLALVFCAIAIVAAVISWTTGSEFQYKPAGITLRQYSDELAYDFDAFGAATAPKGDRLSGPADAARPAAQASAAQLDDPGVDGSCAGRTWPYYSDDCLWAAESPRRRRPVARLRHTWCAGFLRHLPVCLSRRK
jgi:hypothetical protein